MEIGQREYFTDPETYEEILMEVTEIRDDGGYLVISWRRVEHG